MSDKEKKLAFVGKYVCYDAMDGGACWGRIKAEVKVNTRQGEKEAFILEDRYVRYLRTTDLKRFRRFYPDMDHPETSRPLELDGDGNPKSPGDSEFFHEVRKVKGDSLLHLDQIDLARDVIDIASLLVLVNGDTLFDAVMAGRVEHDQLNGTSALEIGLRHMLASDESFTEAAKAEIRRRLSNGQHKRDDSN